MEQRTTGISDLSYVREVVEQVEDRPITPPIIFYLWALIVLGGYLVDHFQHSLVFSYWTVVPLLGAILSAYLGNRYWRNLGIQARRLGRRYGLHWLIFFAGFGLLLPAVKAGQMDWHAFGVMVMLLVALFYLLAALHLDGRFLLVGLVLVGAYLTMLYFPAVSGVVLIGAVVGALVLTGLIIQFSGSYARSLAGRRE